jgi:hypothetical protein
MMNVSYICDKCRCEITTPSTVSFQGGPSRHHEMINLCRSCADAFLKWLGTGRTAETAGSERKAG